MKRNVFSFGKSGIISENTVNSLIFTEMEVIVRDFPVAAKRYFLIFSMSPCSAIEDSCTR